jgi:predicted acylesterase/phospholipase RssA
MARFQILCLTGGGFLGLYTAIVLAALESEAKRPLAHSFDLICGTSIGGILALGLAYEVPAATIVAEFEKRGEEIFPRGRARLLRRAFSAAYSPIPLRSVVQSLLGDNRLLGEAIHPVLVPAVSLTKGSAQVFKTPHHPRFQMDWKLNPVDVAMATSAAPTIFPLARIGDNLYADGGLFANAPDLMAVHEARTFFEGVDVSDIHILSVGTTSQNFTFGHAGGTNLGIMGWARQFRLLRVIMSSQQKLVDDMIRHMLGDRYFRVDAAQSPQQSAELGLDKASRDAIQTLGALAANSVQEIISDARIADFLAHTAAPPRYFHGPRADNRSQAEKPT